MSVEVVGCGLRECAGCECDGDVAGMALAKVHPVVGGARYGSSLIAVVDFTADGFQMQ